jgi:hypothetical protein
LILFIDTEWADALANELVSLALVSDCGRYEFYAERDPLPAVATAFVSQVVYPLLDRGDRALPDNEFTRRLHAFFGRMQAAAKPDRVIVAYDHRNDLDLLGIALEAFDSPETPARPAFQGLDLGSLGGAYKNAIESRFMVNPSLGSRRHHALVDARVNRDVWLEVQADAGQEEDTPPARV